MSHELWLLRHGQSEGNAQSIRQGQSDYQLTDLGRRQFEALAADWLAAAIRFERIISTPLSRAFESARIIADLFKIKVDISDLWQERRSGEAEGTPLAELPIGPTPANSRVAHQPLYPDGETDLPMHIWASRGLQPLLSEEPRRFLVVSHGGILNSALHVILGLAPSGAARLPRFHYTNCSYALVRFDASRQQWQIVKINATSQGRLGE